MRRFFWAPKTNFKTDKKYLQFYAQIFCISEPVVYILSVNEKLPVSKFPYFGKYIIQLFGYSYVHVSGQRQAVLER